jgi:hypothetical protein
VVAGPASCRRQDTAYRDMLYNDEPHEEVPRRILTKHHHPDVMIRPEGGTAISWLHRACPSEPSSEIPLHGVVLRVGAEVARIQHAERHQLCDAHVEARFHQRRVAGDRNAGDREPGANALERERLRMRAPEAFRCRSQMAISDTRWSWVAMRRSRHWLRSTPISISTMLSQLACLGT